MALGWKLVVDSADASTLADFWAAALEYEVEDPGALIERLLAAGHLPEAAVGSHGGRRVFRGFAAVRHPSDPFDEVSGVGRGRRLLFQDVPEDKCCEDVIGHRWVSPLAREHLVPLVSSACPVFVGGTGRSGRARESVTSANAPTGSWDGLL